MPKRSYLKINFSATRSDRNTPRAVARKERITGKSPVLRLRLHTGYDAGLRPEVKVSSSTPDSWVDSFFAPLKIDIQPGDLGLRFFNVLSIRLLIQY